MISTCYTAAEAADKLGVSTSVVTRYCASGRLVARKFGQRLWLIDERDLAAFAKKSRTRGRKRRKSNNHT